MTVTVPKRTNRLGFVLPGFLAAGTVLFVCLAPETPQDPVTQSDVAALTRIHDCDRFGVPAGSPSWSAIAIDDDPDSPDDDALSRCTSLNSTSIACAVRPRVSHWINAMDTRL
ncbi:MAG: hypothetical protein DMF99_23375 [Acidobacteria bacterium]|nr:MAG: hypothetical protein DMF99_23375 [Acidobacteriota bacterium]